MRRYYVLLTLALSLPGVSWSGQTAGGRSNGHISEGSAFPEKFDPARDAAQDIRNAIEAAKESRKHILLDVGGEWCIWCRRLDSLFAAHKDIDDFMHNNYIVVKVNWSPENRNEAVLSRYPKIPGYPHFFVLDSDGKLLRSQDTGELEAGKHHDPAKVFAFLRRWAPGGNSNDPKSKE